MRSPSPSEAEPAERRPYTRAIPADHVSIPAPGDVPTAGAEPLLSVRDLHVRFGRGTRTVKAADGISFDLAPNEVLGIVGESGSGKTVTALAILGLLPSSASVSGDVRFRGTSLLELPDAEARALRGARIAMVFQDALAALNPLHKVGNQVAEAIRIHHPDVGRKAARQQVVELLGLVGIPNPRARYDEYPHQFSGGMRQRAMIAMAIANEPDLLIADEPTTALDVTTQAQVLDVLRRVRERTGSAMVLITHDLGVVAGVADRMIVMYAGRVVETGTAREVYSQPHHPYTIGLLASQPRLDRGGVRRLERIPGHPPSLVDVPSGCPFHPRCGFARLPGPCATDEPALVSPGHDGHAAACHFAGDLPGSTDRQAAAP